MASFVHLYLACRRGKAADHPINMPLVYFFPELALSTLRAYKAYQFPDGAAPWIFGGRAREEGTELAIPSRGHQTTSNGPSYFGMVDRYWLRTGGDRILREFYSSVKKNTIYTMNLNPGPDGVISMPAGNVDRAAAGSPMSGSKASSSTA